MAHARQLETEVLSLNPESRARMATLLIRSLEDEATIDQAENKRLWLDEAEARARQIDAGEVELLSADDVLEGIRKQLE